MDSAEKDRLLAKNMYNIKIDLYELKEYADSLNTQKLGKPGTTIVPEIQLSSKISSVEESAATGGGKRKSSSKKRKSKKRKSKKRKSKTHRRR